MGTLSVDRFEEFFMGLWGEGKVPFAWQRELVRRLLSASQGTLWPEVISLPTGSGKTACLDIAVYVLAAQAEQVRAGKVRTAPLRIFFVVDRRVIVNEAYNRACILASKLRHADGGILREVADNLRYFSGGDIPLSCFQLRGGIFRSDAWARSPIQPTIVTSTVDQFGSRLLFRSYGGSSRAWPIHAGLTGNDSLIFLDEVHCAQPFLETSKAVEKYRQWALKPLYSPFQVVVMSATPPKNLGNIFRDESIESRTPGHPLGNRQLASKPTNLLISVPAKGKKALEGLADTLIDTAENLVASRPLATVIFTNRVATARNVYRRLEVGNPGAEVILLTGRMRSFDKDDNLTIKLRELSSMVSEKRRLSVPMYVVTTQTLEVGADLDFDLLVTECASLDALRQRFGRLNRMGRTLEGTDPEGRPLGARAAIVVRSDQKEKSDDDPVYGSALAETWKWLENLGGDDKIIDMGITALASRLDTLPDEERLNVTTSHAPVMLPAHVDSLVQTSPEPFPTPDISFFLHGNQKTSADVQICWRVDLDPEEEDEEKLIEIANICPPSAPECLPVNIGTIRHWMAGRNTSGTESSDMDGDVEIDDENKAGIPGRKVIRWRGRTDVKLVTDEQEIRPGDVLLIPAAMGAEDLGDLARQPDGNAILDWGDRAYSQTHGKAMLRIVVSNLNQWPNSETVQQIKDLAIDAKNRFEDEPGSVASDLRDALRRLSAVPRAASNPKGLLPSIPLSVRSLIRSFLRFASSMIC